MGKQKLLKQIDNQKQQIETQQKMFETQCQVTENVMNIFKVLMGGGHISVHIHPDKDPSYFIYAKDKKETDMESCTRKIFEGFYSRGLLVVKNESIHEDFAAQTYVLRTSKEQ